MCVCVSMCVYEWVVLHRPMLSSWCVFKWRCYPSLVNSPRLAYWWQSGEDCTCHYPRLLHTAEYSQNALDMVLTVCVCVRERLEASSVNLCSCTGVWLCVVHTERHGGSCAFYGNCLHARMPSWSQAQHAAEALWKCNQSAPTGVPQFIWNCKSQNWPKEIG